MTVREAMASGEWGTFWQKLLETYDDPCAGNFRLLRAVADGENAFAIEYAIAEAGTRCDGLAPCDAHLREALAAHFPLLQDLDREVTAADYDRLPREAQA